MAFYPVRAPPLSVAKLDEDEKITALIQGTGSNYKSNAVLINESGLYTLVLSSRKPEVNRGL